MSTYRNSLEHYLSELHIYADRVLDIGGAANPARTRITNIDCRDYVILDSGAELPKDKFIRFDINYELPISLKRKVGKFNVVFCLEVFEYIFDPIVALLNIKDLLEDDGCAYITFQTLYPLHNPEGIDCLRYMRDGINKLLDEVGMFEMMCVKRMPTEQGLAHLKSFYSSEGLHFRRNVDDPFCMGYISKVAKK